jgi:NitT/TauT family transport system substrate-binding protein
MIPFMLKLVALCALTLLSTALPARAADTVKAGFLRLPQPTFVGIEKGFFREEGIDLQPVFFQSGAALVPSLATGQIDVAYASTGAALFNAFALGSQMAIVADFFTAAKDAPTGDTQFFVARKDLVTNGTFKPARGMTLAITARGQVTDLFSRLYLAANGLSDTDIKIVTLAYPDMLAAFSNKAIDMAVAIEPFVTVAEQSGSALRVGAESSYAPGIIQAATIYGEKLAKQNRDLGMRYMRALTKSNRYVRTQLRTAAGRTELAAIYQKYVPIENPALYEKIGIGTGLDNLAVDVDGKFGLRWELQEFTAAGLVTKQPDLKTAVDNSFANAAAKAK